MKRLFVPLMLVALLVTLFPVVAAADPVSVPAVNYKLIAGQNLQVGWVEVSYDAGVLHVKYVMLQPMWEAGYCLEETHVHVADSLAGIPQTNGNPIPGQFDYKQDDLGCVRRVDYWIPLAGWDGTTPLYIAAHAVIHNAYDPYFDETGWGVWCGHIDRYAFPGSNWAAYIIYPLPE